MNRPNCFVKLKTPGFAIAISLLLSFSVFNTGVQATPGYFQQKVVTGRVTDEKGDGISNVSVSVKGTTRGTVTKTDGSFSINANAGETLSFSNVGYKASSVVLGSESTVSMTLSVDASSLADVVVVGYGTQKKVTVTGAVSAIKGEALIKSPAVDLSNSLAGRLPGLVIIQQSGEPGYDGAKINIRGTNTLGNSDRLVVIDGVP